MKIVIVFIGVVFSGSIVSSHFDPYDQSEPKRSRQEPVTKISVPEEQALTNLFNQNGLQEFFEKTDIASLGGLTLSAGDYVERVSDLCKSFKGDNKPTVQKVIGVISGDDSIEWLQSIGELPDKSKWLPIKKG